MVFYRLISIQKKEANLDHDETGTTVVGSPEVDIGLVSRDVKALDTSSTSVKLRGGSSEGSAGGGGDGEEGELHLERLICLVDDSCVWVALVLLIK